MTNSSRHEIPERPACQRAHDFMEVTTGYDFATAKAEAERCLHCKNAPCMQGCPVSVHIPDFIAAVISGDIDKAGAIIEDTNSLPSICGRVCPQENQCESKCVRGIKSQPVAIGALERFVGDYMLNRAAKPVAAKLTGKRVAVVGSGPSGLTCASELITDGVEVVVYGSPHRPGGVLIYGIPEFRLSKKLVDKEIDLLKDRGVRFETNMIVGKTVTMEELQRQYDAVFIGSGAGLPVFMGIPGENLNGVFSANEYLTRVNLMGAYDKDAATPVMRGKNVAVVGAGNVAMDAARTALRMGAETVTVVYRRGREEMPARREEIRHAEEEGIKFELLSNPVEMLGQNGWVTGLKCIRMQLGEPDASGRRRPEPVAGSEFVFAADMVIVALGTSPNPLLTHSFPALKTGRRGIIETDENMLTSVSGVYAGGDAVTGAATVILAMGAGRKAAHSIKKQLFGE